MFPDSKIASSYCQKDKVWYNSRILLEFVSLLLKNPFFITFLVCFSAYFFLFFKCTPVETLEVLFKAVPHHTIEAASVFITCYEFSLTIGPQLPIMLFLHHNISSLAWFGMVTFLLKFIL